MMLYAGSYCSLCSVLGLATVFLWSRLCLGHVEIISGRFSRWLWPLWISFEEQREIQFSGRLLPSLLARQARTRGHHRDMMRYQSHLHERERYSQFILQSRVKFDWGSCHVSHACHVAGRGPRVSSLECEPSNNWVSSAGDSSPLDDERDIRRQPAKEC